MTSDLLKFDTEVQEDGRIALEVPTLPPGARVTVFVTQEQVGDVYALLAPESVPDFPLDDEDWFEDEWGYGGGWDEWDNVEEWEGVQVDRLVTDPQETERLAEKREDENWAFRNWIKVEFGFDDERLMSVVNELTEAITAQIDCTECANCCRVTATRLEEEDVERLAEALDMSIPAFQDAYLEFVEEAGGHWKLPAPCPLLEGNLCRVYEARPVNCRAYPHLLHKDFRAHSISRIHSTFTCPIVFNVVEEMKYALRWPQRNRWRR